MKVVCLLAFTAYASALPIQKIERRAFWDDIASLFQALGPTQTQVAKAVQTTGQETILGSPQVTEDTQDIVSPTKKVHTVTITVNNDAQPIPTSSTSTKNNLWAALLNTNPANDNIYPTTTANTQPQQITPSTNIQVSPSADINIVSQVSTSTTNPTPTLIYSTSSSRNAQFISASTASSSSLTNPTAYYSSVYDPSTAFDNAIKTIWSTFWDASQDSFQDTKCQGSSFTSPSVWTLAVAGKAMTDSQTEDYITRIVANLKDYQSSDGWFSASTAKDDDVYTDDNAQILWVFVEAYQQTQNQDYLQTAKRLMDLIKSEWSATRGGIRWSINGNYIASISTTEAALSAVKMYDITKDEGLLSFANYCIEWIYNNLMDSDGLIEDGVNEQTGVVNKGKLTYTVGTLMSTLSYMYKFTGNQDYLTNATALATAAMKKDGAFYTNGYWNNNLAYVHLLFAGFADYLTMGTSNSDFVSELKRQGKYIFEYYQDQGQFYATPTSGTQNLYSKYTANIGSAAAYSPDKSSLCDNSQVKYSLMSDASAAQIFYELKRVS